MSFTMNELGEVLTETQDGVTMPIDCSFERVNDWIHGIDVQFEELQALCLGMAAENDRLRKTAFSVIAGKWDDQERNCKYSDDFDTLDQAIEAYDKVSGYPWAYIEYQGRILRLWDKGVHPLR